MAMAEAIAGKEEEVVVATVAVAEEALVILERGESLKEEVRTQKKKTRTKEQRAAEMK